MTVCHVTLLRKLHAAMLHVISNISQHPLLSQRKTWNCLQRLL